MTRINSSIKPYELCDKHLIAEYREITRVPNLALNWLNNGKKSDIPDCFRLGNGHVKFFYNKIKYLHLRFLDIKKELIKRGFDANIEDSRFNSLKDTELYNDWKETKKSRDLICKRIYERLENKKIRHYKKNISKEQYFKNVFKM